MKVIPLVPLFKRNDKKARWLIYLTSFLVFAAVVILGKVKIDADLPFDVHVFALINAIINSMVTILLMAGLATIWQKKYVQHKKIMIAAITLSCLFLLSYVAHHLLAGETKFGDTDHNGMVSESEIAAAGSLRYVYYGLLLTHIPLAAIILPFILFTAYRSLTGEYDRHKKLARITWPIWFYVALSGVFVFLLIHPYYH